jgi:hypothetical protein
MQRAALFETMSWFDAHRISWTIGDFQAGSLLDNADEFTGTILDRAGTCDAAAAQPVASNGIREVSRRARLELSPVRLYLCQESTSQVQIRVVLKRLENCRFRGSSVTGAVQRNRQIHSRGRKSRIARQRILPEADCFPRAASLHIVDAKVGGCGNMCRVEAQNSLAQSQRFFLLTHLVVELRQLSQDRYILRRTGCRFLQKFESLWSDTWLSRSNHSVCEGEIAWIRRRIPKGH